MNDYWIHPTAYVAPCVKIGMGVRIGPNCSIGSPGFGFERDEDDEWQFREHPFGVELGDRVWIGANTVINCGRWRHTEIGAGTKIDGAVFIGHNVVVGQRTLIVAKTIIGGSCELGDDVWVGPGVSFRDHITVGDGAMLGVGTVVTKNIPAGEIWVGNPCRFLRLNKRVRSNTGVSVG